MAHALPTAHRTGGQISCQRHHVFFVDFGCSQLLEYDVVTLLWEIIDDLHRTSGDQAIVKLSLPVSVRLSRRCLALSPETHRMATHCSWNPPLLSKCLANIPKKDQTSRHGLGSEPALP
jgi:hypothetical protein